MVALKWARLTPLSSRTPSEAMASDGEVSDGAPSVPPVPSQPTCTDGVDCRCDLLLAELGEALVFCEDFENPRLQEPGVWQGNPNSPPFGGWRDQRYSGIVPDCGGGAGASGRDITNTGYCIDITRRDDLTSTDLESVPEAHLVFDGSHSMAQVSRPPINPETGPWNAGGLHGLANLDRPVRNFGITRAIYYTENLDPFGAAWKDDQFTPARMGFFGTTNSTPCGGGWAEAPYAGTIWSAAGPESFRAVVGTACDSNRLKMVADPTRYQFQRGVWRCQQIQYEGWGTDEARVRHWWDEELVLDIQDIDMSSHDNARVDLAGLSQFEWNNYYNGIGRDAYTQGYRGTTREGRIKDNMVISEGEPVSCASIGF